MLHKVTRGRHAVVGVVIVALSMLAGFRVIGAGDAAVFRPEHFDAKQVTVWPDGADGVRIREVVDIDFGINERRGYQRIVPNDFDEPIDITAVSRTADDGVKTLDLGSRTRIRVGDPNVTYTGQHRYVLEYTLPDAQISTGVLALDIIGTDETFQTDRFEVVLAGFDLTDTTCDTGSYGQFGGCSLARDDAGRHVAVIEPLEPGEGITVGGAIAALTTPDLPEPPAAPDPIPSGFQPLGLLVAVLGLAASGGVFALSRWYGSNEIVSGGAADAAYGALPAPQVGDRVADVPTHRVPDSRLAELATIEFVPPRGLEPWQGAALLRERVDDDNVSAWFSGMIAQGAIVLDDGDDLRLRPGENIARLSAVDQAHLKALFGSKRSVKLGKYSKSFTTTWNKISREQRRFVRDSGWWRRGAPDGPGFNVRSLASFIFLVPFAFLVVFGDGPIGDARSSWLGVLAPAWVAIVGSVAIVALASFLAYRSLLPARTATGSALALLTESFRRFLAASEGRHVEWAWDNGLLREYSAWAVALGEADAWKRAVESSNIPHPEQALRGPLLVHTNASSFRSAHTKPSSSGSGSGGSFGGGFSGGGVGGGGGGGSSGSW